MRFNSFGSRLGSRFGMGLQPLWQALHGECIVGHSGRPRPLGGLDSPVSYTASGSWWEGLMGGAEKHQIQMHLLLGISRNLGKHTTAS